MPFEIVRNDITTSVKLSEKLRQSLAGYIDENYVEEYGVRENTRSYKRRCRSVEACESSAVVKEMPLPEAVEELHPCAQMAAPKELSLEDMLEQADAGFTETLLRLIDQTGKKDSEIYKKANISKQHFSKIRNNPDYKPTKPTALALALALELSLEDTKDLIGRAGYALTNSSKFDLIIRYFIEQHNYNVVEINMALYEFDQTLLGT